VGPCIPYVTSLSFYVNDFTSHLYDKILYAIFHQTHSYTSVLWTDMAWQRHYWSNNALNVLVLVLRLPWIITGVRSINGYNLVLSNFDPIHFFSKNKGFQPFGTSVPPNQNFTPLLTPKSELYPLWIPGPK
jgi:hypothetical protein